MADGRAASGNTAKLAGTARQALNWMIASSSSDVVRSGRWVLASQITTSAANLVTTVILLRTLGLAGFGQFSLCFLVLMVVRTFFHGAILAPASTIAPRLHPVAATPWKGVLAVLALGFSGVSSVALFGLLFLLSVPMQAPWLPGLLVPLCLANAGACFADLVSRYQVIEGRPQKAFGIEALRYLVQVSGLLALGVPGFLPAEPSAALLVLASGSCAATLMGSLMAGPLAWSFRLFRVLWPRFQNFLKWMTLANLVETIQTLAPMFIGLAVLGDSALGVLRAISQITNILNLPTNALQQLLPTLGTRVFQSIGSDGLHRFLSKVALWSLLYFVLMGAVLFAFSSTIASLLFGGMPDQYVAILILFVAANLFISIRVIFSTSFVVHETPHQIFRVQGASAVIATGLAFTAALWGPIAIAMSIAASTLCGLALCLWLSLRGNRNG